VTEGSAPVVVFVAGYGRSGSTILEMALGLAHGVRGVGEVTHLFRELRAGRRCTCGEPLGACEAWASLGRRLAPVDPAEAEAATRHVEGRVALLRPPPDSDPRVRLYAGVWRAVFEELGTTHGVIVDSSKSAGAAGRPFALARYCGLDVRVIHLVRDPRAVMWSVLRGSNRRMLAGESAHQRWGMPRALLGWSVANLCAERSIRQARLPGIRLRYEDFVRDPGGSLRRTGEALGLELGGAAESLSGEYFLGPGHGVAGNRVRAVGVRALHLDREWEDRLPRRARLLALLAAPLSARYGYGLSG
jgi:hypothetical protein